MVVSDIQNRTFQKLFQLIFPKFRFLGGCGAILVAASMAQGGQPSVQYIDLGRGPVPIYLPSSYIESEPLPLIVALHGYKMNGAQIENYLNLIEQVESKRFLYCIPEGTLNSRGHRFWNATDACCDFKGENVDDSTYLRNLVNFIHDNYVLDDVSIHFIGFSNGGFMSYRMACDHADIISSIISLSGMTYLDASRCEPSEAVSILHVHGNSDQLVQFNGGCFDSKAFCYPSATLSALRWTDYNGCDPIREESDVVFDLDWSVSGNETTSKIYDQNCKQGVSVELWEMSDSGHKVRFRGPGEPVNTNRFSQRAVDWLLAHRKERIGIGKAQ